MNVTFSLPLTRLFLNQSHYFLFAGSYLPKDKTGITFLLKYLLSSHCLQKTTTTNKQKTNALDSEMIQSVSPDFVVLVVLFCSHHCPSHTLCHYPTNLLKDISQNLIHLKSGCFRTKMHSFLKYNNIGYFFLALCNVIIQVIV